MRVKSTSIRSLPSGFRYANIGEEYLLYGSVVMIPYSCTRASSTSRSTFKLVGVGKLCAYTGSSCLGGNLILKSVLIPMSKRWRAKIMWYLTSSASILCCSCSLRTESFQLQFLRNLCRYSSSQVGSSFPASGVLDDLVVYSALNFVELVRVVACFGCRVPTFVRGCLRVLEQLIDRFRLHRGIWRSRSMAPSS